MRAFISTFLMKTKLKKKEVQGRRFPEEVKTATQICGRRKKKRGEVGGKLDNNLSIPSHQRKGKRAEPVDALTLLCRHEKKGGREEGGGGDTPAFHFLLKETEKIVQALPHRCGIVWKEEKRGKSFFHFSNTMPEKRGGRFAVLLYHDALQEKEKKKGVYVPVS